jgi:sulfoxide reductase heme-binding subunit YedZ
MARHLLKPLVFVACLAPLAWLAGRGLAGMLGANPVEAVVRFLGDWSLRMLLVALAVTPLRQWTGWARLGSLRRMLGLFAFTYVMLHLLAYIGLDQFFDWPMIGAEIVKRRYITAGMAASLMLVPLAVTSTNGWVKRLGGGRWRRLHRLVYGIAPLAVMHHWMMVKRDISEPALHAAILSVLLGWRVLAAWRAHRHNGAEAVAGKSPCVRSS